MTNPSLRIHTHWQVAQIPDPQYQTCQRVWLPQRTEEESTGIQQSV